jgi:glucose/mannose transport system substrate-binding protein
MRRRPCRCWASTSWTGPEGALADLTATATAEGWDKVVPTALQAFSTHDGKWIAAPVNVHSTNWVWINKAALDAHRQGAETWEELVAVLDAMKANGITPLAHGGQAWQDATVFDGVVLGMGADFYKAAFIDLDPAALGGEQMAEAFNRLIKLRSYVDDNFSGRDWNLASAMVINGEAGMQMMGDWAKGEFLKAGKVPGTDFVCIRFPGTQGLVTFNSDQFAMFNQTDPAAQEAQVAMAKAIMDPAFQSAFNVVKGSVPARTDVPNDRLRRLRQEGHGGPGRGQCLGWLFGSMAHGHAAPASVKNATYDVITAAFNGEYADGAAAAAALGRSRRRRAVSCTGGGSGRPPIQIP